MQKKIQTRSKILANRNPKDPLCFKFSLESSFQAIKKLLCKKEVDKNAEVNKKLLKSAKILERMVNQNTYNDIAQGIRISIHLLDLCENTQFMK